MTEQNTTTEPTEADLRRKAYSAAEKALREAHADEFRALVTKEAQALGVEYKFRPTKEERAEREIAKLLADNPGLRERFAPTDG